MNPYETWVRQHPQLPWRTNEVLASHTTFRIGGPADLFAEPSTIEELQAFLAIQKQTQWPCFLMGNGSNLLIRDGGIRGMVIVLADRFSQIQPISETQLRVQAGARLSAIARAAWSLGLGGFEFASGIPGTLGGAVTMNAGAYGGEMQQVVESVWAINCDGHLVSLSKEAMEFGYRHSKVMDDNLIVVEAQLKLTPKDPGEIKDYLDDLAERRRSKQPIQLPSAGSFFKRPPGQFAGALIEQAGLKGLRVGDAQVSELHAGFIVNVGAATASDVLQLMETIQNKVMQMFGVMLEPEVRIVGEDKA